MRVKILDRDVLTAVRPAALSSYARSRGWAQQERYRIYSDLYVGEGLPEIFVPRTQDLGDYASVVSRLIETFSEVSGQDELTVHRDLVTADRDVVRLRTCDPDHSGSLPVTAGADLVCGARDLILAAACSLDQPQAVYRMGASREAAEYLDKVRLGQTDRGSYVVTLLGPELPSMAQMARQGLDAIYEPAERQVTRRLADSVLEARKAVDESRAGREDPFVERVHKGVSANLCEALAQLAGVASELEISLVWALIHPREEARTVIRFAEADRSLLADAGNALRRCNQVHEAALVGYVKSLARNEHELEGQVTLQAQIEGSTRSVRANLSQPDYDRAIDAHRNRVPVALRGDLQHSGSRWSLLNSRVVSAGSDAESK